MSQVPTTLKLHRKARRLEVGYADGKRYELPCEYLRVFSPSAEVRGHGAKPKAGVPYEPQLIGGKREVNISAIEPVGRYAVRLRFTDGHDTGLYSWDVFEELGVNQHAWWTRYEARLAEHGMSRDRDVTTLSALPSKSGVSGVRIHKPAGKPEPQS